MSSISAVGVGAIEEVTELQGACPAHGGGRAACGPEEYCYYDYAGIPTAARDGFTYISVMNDYSAYGPDIGSDWLKDADLYLSATDAIDRTTVSYLRTDVAATVTPEPASMLLLGSGLAGLAATTLAAAPGIV